MMNQLNETREKLDKTEKEYLQVRREYAKQEFGIITTFDFKEKYGKDNEKIRKEHVRRELKQLAEKKDELYLEYEKTKRKYECLKIMEEKS